MLHFFTGLVLGALFITYLGFRVDRKDKRVGRWSALAVEDSRRIKYRTTIIIPKKTYEMTYDKDRLN